MQSRPSLLTPKSRAEGRMAFLEGGQFVETFEHELVQRVAGSQNIPSTDFKSLPDYESNGYDQSDDSGMIYYDAKEEQPQNDLDLLGTRDSAGLIEVGARFAGPAGNHLTASHADGQTLQGCHLESNQARVMTQQSVSA